MDLHCHKPHQDSLGASVDQGCWFGFHRVTWQSGMDLSAAVSETTSVEKRRECILKAVCLYLNESPDDLIKESLDADLEAEQATNEQLDMVIHVIQHEGAEPTDDPAEVNIFIEGVEVLQDVKDVAYGCALLLGLIYCLNLEFPSKLKYTFELIQKVLMDMDGQKLSPKLQALKVNYMIKGKFTKFLKHNSLDFSQLEFS